MMNCRSKLSHSWLAALIACLCMADSGPSQEFVRSPREDQPREENPPALIPARYDSILEVHSSTDDAPPSDKQPSAPKLNIGVLPGETRAIPEDAWRLQLYLRPGDENVLRMASENKQVELYMGGRLQLDTAFVNTTDRVMFGPNGIGRLDDAVNIRRARYDLGGTLFENIDFLMEWDFSNTTNAERSGTPLPINTPVPTDQWVQFKNLPFVGNLRIGNQKTPLAIEHLTSSRFLHFLERSLAFDAFLEYQNNGFQPGLLLFNQYLDKHLYLAAGVFKNTRSIFGWNVGDGEYEVVARVAGLLCWEDDGRRFLHLGLGATHADLDEDIARYRARILIRNGPATLHNIVAEATLNGSSRDMIVPEFAMNYDAWTLAADYYAVWTHNATWPLAPSPNRADRGTAFFQGGYFEALYFLTGEYTGYDRSRFAFARVDPNHNWQPWGKRGPNDGWGAWQIGARYDWLNLNSRGITGNIVHDWTLGLNWYLNPHMKIQWNYTLEYRSAVNNKGLIQAFGTRIALNF